MLTYCSMEHKNHRLYSRLRILFLIVWLLMSFGITYYLIQYLKNRSIPVELSYRDLAAIFAALVASGTLIFHGMNVHLTVKSNFQKLLFDKEKLEYDKKQVVFKLIEEFNSKSFIKYTTEMKDFLDANNHLDAVTFGMRLDENREARIAVAAFLNELERIALVYCKNAGDGDLIYEFFQDIFISYYKRYSFYIKVRREKSGSKNIFDTFEQVVQEWQKKKLG
jgi:hypothetical protein